MRLQNVNVYVWTGPQTQLLGRAIVVKFYRAIYFEIFISEGKCYIF